eukprot:m.253346 g.253346  ORF g.253346 m.253346 type:complete len:553 (+) comp11000_c1_seq1:1513-3171(+)
MIILFAARLTHQKGVDMLVSVAKRVCEHTPGARFVIAGAGPLAHLLAQLPQPCAIVLGAVDGDEMTQLVGSSDVLFLPSRFEGIASVLFEGMAAGAVVVAADVGGQAELVTPQTGYLCSSNLSPEEQARWYSDTLDMLARETSKRLEIGRQARARIENQFTLKHTASCVTQALCQVHVESQSSTSIELARAVLEHGQVELKRAATAQKIWSTLQQGASPPGSMTAAAPFGWQQTTISLDRACNWPSAGWKLLGAEVALLPRTLSVVFSRESSPSKSPRKCIATFVFEQVGDNIQEESSDPQCLQPLQLLLNPDFEGLLLHSALQFCGVDGERSLFVTLSCDEHIELGSCDASHRQPMTRVQLLAILADEKNSMSSQQKRSGAAVFTPFESFSAELGISLVHDSLLLDRVSVSMSESKSAEQSLTLGLAWSSSARMVATPWIKVFARDQFGEELTRREGHYPMPLRDLRGHRLPQMPLPGHSTILTTTEVLLKTSPTQVREVAVSLWQGNSTTEHKLICPHFPEDVVECNHEAGDVGGATLFVLRLGTLPGEL